MRLWTLLRNMYIFRQILTWNYMYMYMSIEKNWLYRQDTKHWLQTSFYTDLKDFHSLLMHGTFHKLLHTIYIPSDPNHFTNEATFKFVLLQHKVSQSSIFVAKKTHFSLTTYLDIVISKWFCSNNCYMFTTELSSALFMVTPGIH